MGSKKILKWTKHGPILAKRKSESMKNFVKRQEKAFKSFQKKKRRKKK